MLEELSRRPLVQLPTPLRRGAHRTRLSLKFFRCGVTTPPRFHSITRKTPRRTNIIVHTAVRADREPLDPRKPSISQGKGLRLPCIARHPPIRNHLCSARKCQGPASAWSPQALGTEVARRRARLHAGPPGPPGLELRRWREPRPQAAPLPPVPIQSRAAPGHQPTEWRRSGVRKWPSPPGRWAQQAGVPGGAPHTLPAPAAPRAGPPPWTRLSGRASPGRTPPGRPRQARPLTWPRPLRGSRLRGPRAAARRPGSGHSLPRTPSNAGAATSFGRGRAPRDSSKGPPPAPRPAPPRPRGGAQRRPLL